MSGHRPGEVGIQGERQDIRADIAGLDSRQGQVAIHPRPPVARRMLAHRLHTCRQQSRRHRSPQPAHYGGIGAERAVADYVMGIGIDQVQHWRADHIEPDIGTIRADQGPG